METEAAAEEWDALATALNRWGVRHIAPGGSAPAGTPHSAVELFERLVGATEPRLQQAAVLLLLTHPHLASDARAAIDRLGGVRRDRAMRRYVAAAALQRMARTRIALDRGSQPLVPPTYLDELDLPSLDEAFGRETLLTLADGEQARYGYDAPGYLPRPARSVPGGDPSPRLGDDVRQRTDRARLNQFLRALGGRMRRPVRLYLVGGSVQIDLGLRAATLGIDYVVDADDAAALAEFKEAVRGLRNELDVNVEPASPADFLPIPRSVLDRSRYIGRYGSVSVYYYHLPSLVIAKAARGFEQDLADAERLVAAGEVAWEDVEATWREVRASPTGWLRYEPDEVERRLDLLRRRLGSAPS